MPFCKKCGYEIYRDDQFCYRCGAPIGPAAKSGKAKAPAKPQPIIPTETAPSEEIPPEAPKKAGKFKLGRSVIPMAVVATVVVVSLGVAIWWFIGSSAPEKLIFKDDFSNTNSGWWVGSGDWGGVAYSDGELVMYRKEGGNWTYTTNENMDQQTDSTVEVDTRKIPEGMGENYCGILFRFQDTDNYYGFFVNSQGEYDVGKSVNGQFSRLKDWTQSDYIKTGTATNKLKVTCRGNKIEVYANGHKLTTIEDNSLSTGDIALEVLTFESTPTTEYRFDNFKLYQAEATGETSVTEPSASEVPTAEEAAPEDTSTESTGEWLVYADDAFGYSVEYPSSWSLNTFMAFIGTVLITEPGNKAVISTSVLPVGEVQLDDLVTGITDYQRQNYFYYEPISNDLVTHQGISARVVEYVYQEEAEKPRYRSSELFTIVNGMKYSIKLSVTPPADFGSYSQLFQKVMSSFHVP